MREKLIELLGADTCKKECEDCKYCANPEACIEYLKTSMADHLIANGVTMEAYDCHWATETAYKNGYEQGKKDALKWIPVTERLPELRIREYEEADGTRKQFWVSDKQLVFSSRGYITTANYETGPKYQGWLINPCDTIQNITHWMPLPEPPEKGA